MAAACKKFIDCAACGISVEKTSNRQFRCKNCTRLRNLEDQKKKSAATAALKPTKYISCKMCGSQTEYWSHKTVCEACRPAQEKTTADEWARNNRDKVNATASRYRERHGEKLKSHRAKNRVNYREQEREYCRSKRRRELVNKWEKEKRAKDPGYDISKRISHQIRLAIKANKSGRGWEDLVGYSLEDLTKHLERQFLPRMSWDNRDEWHIDHIVPQASFKFSTAEEDEFKACWSITNLRPLWADKNLSKSDKRIFLI